MELYEICNSMHNSPMIISVVLQAESQFKQLSFVSDADNSVTEWKCESLLAPKVF